MASAFDENRNDTGLASRRNPRHRAIESEGTHVRFNGFGQIDRNPAFSSQHAHQPAAYENMLGIEGDRAGQVAPWLEPSGARRLLIELWRYLKHGVVPAGAIVVADRRFAHSVRR